MSDPDEVVLLAHGDEGAPALKSLLSPRYVVRHVADGDGVLAAARHHRPNLLLMRGMLPGLGGLDVLPQGRDEPMLEKLPVILVIGPDDQEPGFCGLEFGGDDLLRGRVDPPERPSPL